VCNALVGEVSSADSNPAIAHRRMAWLWLTKWYWIYRGVAGRWRV